jgi:tRNA dimethylallyltransferase
MPAENADGDNRRSVAVGSRSGIEQITLVGPTAVGKSEVALLLAERLSGEIVSVDSMQVYRGLDIGTAKPGAAERLRVPHHLIDVADLDEPFDAARFVGLASAAIQDIQSRGRIPILCGGTGFYLKALVEGLGHSPAGNVELRAELEVTPLAILLKELAERDPVAYGQIDRRNPRRVIRAVEVIRLTGKRFSEMRPGRDEQASDRNSRPDRVFSLVRAGEDLRARIDARVNRMFERGLVEETRRLLERGLASNKTAMQALGYRQVVEHLRDERPLPDTIALVKQRTWQFARRQMTWLRRQLQATWIQWEADRTASDIAEKVMSALT